MKAKKIFKGMTAAAIAAVLATTMVPMTAFVVNAETITADTTTANLTLGEQTITMPATPARAKYAIYKVASAQLASGSKAYTYSIENSFVGSVTGFGQSSGTLIYKDQPLSTDTSATDVQALAKGLESFVSSNSPTATANNLAASATANLTPGYYLILSSGTQMQAAPILLSVRSDMTDAQKILTAKSSDLTFDKNITNITNGSTATSKTAEGAIGSVVSYEIVTSFPTYAEAVPADNIKDFVITDNPASGITIDKDNPSEDILIYVDSNNDGTYADNEKLPDTTAILDTTSPTDGGFVATFGGDYVKSNEGKGIKIAFKATINNSAQSQTAIPNDAKLSYGNEFLTGQGNGTFTSETNVYRTDLIVLKNDDSNPTANPIQGVGFTIYKWSDTADGNKGDAIGTERITGDDGKITMKDIPAGKYVLEETTVPYGYKKADNKTIEIIANKNDQSQQYNGTYTFKVDNSSISGDIITVVNQKGQILPGTGGIGTTIFTIAGVGVVVLAGAMLVVYMRKRKADEE